MVKMVNYGIVVSEYEFQSPYYVNFQTKTLGEKYELSYTFSYGSIVLLLISYKDGFGIK